MLLSNFSGNVFNVVSYVRSVRYLDWTYERRIED
jgi:hypothetical protein